MHPPASSTQPLRAAVTADAIEAQAQHLGAPLRLDDVTAFRLEPWTGAISEPDPAALLPVPRSAFHATASTAVDRLRLAFDGIAATRWLGGPPQRGQEWIAMEFDRPRRIARVDLELAGDISDYPRRLRIEGRTSGDQVEILYDGSVVPWLARALLRNPAAAAIEIPLSPQRPVHALTIRQTGRTAVWGWSVHELRIWEQRASP